MIYEYGQPERWRPGLKMKVLEQCKWIEELKNAVRDSHALQTPVQTGRRLALDKARRISAFALIFSRLMAAKEALLDAIQDEGQPATWSGTTKLQLDWEFSYLEKFLKRLKV